eukprot:gene26141-11859_t
MVEEIGQFCMGIGLWIDARSRIAPPRMWATGLGKRISVGDMGVHEPHCASARFTGDGEICLLIVASLAWYLEAVDAPEKSAIETVAIELQPSKRIIVASLAWYLQAVDALEKPAIETVAIDLQPPQRNKYSNVSSHLAQFAQTWHPAPWRGVEAPQAGGCIVAQPLLPACGSYGPRMSSQVKVASLYKSRCACIVLKGSWT